MFIINCALINQLDQLFLASSHFCQLLMTFASSLDPDQDWQNVNSVPEFLLFVVEKVYFEKSQQMVNKSTILSTYAKAPLFG